MSAAPVFASDRDAAAMIQAGLRYLATRDATGLAGETQGWCLRSLEESAGMLTAARASILGAFTTAKNYTADAEYGSRSWLVNRTGVTESAASAHLRWSRWLACHLHIRAAMNDRDITESIALQLIKWLQLLPQDCQADAEAILVAAARSGATLADLAGLVAEIQSRSAPAPDPGDDDPDRTFDDRAVVLETTFDGAGYVHGNLTPDCAADVTAMLDTLAAPRGAEDDRTRAQRFHDALHEAARRLLASGTLPARAGQPVKAYVHMTLADMLDLDTSTGLRAQWIARVRAAWASHRARTSIEGGDGGAWLDGDQARAAACDATLVPVVTGDVDPRALDDLVRLCQLLGRTTGPGTAEPAAPEPAAELIYSGQGQPWDAHQQMGQEQLEQAIIGKTIDLLSGPEGLASWLRRSELGSRLGGPSVVLDIGVSDNIPAGIRQAVRLRDQHCQFPTGCTQPAAACEIHHVIHQADGGKTSTGNCILLCFFHHHVVIHQWGWTLVLQPDGTTMAWNPDKTKVYRSHAPPARPG